MSVVLFEVEYVYGPYEEKNGEIGCFNDSDAPRRGMRGCADVDEDFC